MDREQAVGLFSELSMVLGALEHDERWKQQYAGLCVHDGRPLLDDPAVGLEPAGIFRAHQRRRHERRSREASVLR